MISTFHKKYFLICQNIFKLITINVIVCLQVGELLLFTMFLEPQVDGDAAFVGNLPVEVPESSSQYSEVLKALKQEERRDLINWLSVDARLKTDVKAEGDVGLELSNENCLA